MECKRLDWKDYFPQLAGEGANPRVDVYLPEPLEEMGRGGQKRPMLVICPGGAYRFCSQREAEPIALHFLTEGYCVLVLSYSVAPPCFSPAAAGGSWGAGADLSKCRTVAL